MSDSIPRIKYMPQLDSLRAFFLIFVIIYHWIPGNVLSNYPIAFGGMLFFFVLSSFLITQILLISKLSSEETNKNKIHVFKQYYIRRTLRIFPIYYLTLIVFYIFNVQGIRNFIWYFLLYVGNVYFFKIQSFVFLVGIMWSLSVEEQFYIIWPFLILFVSKKYLLAAIIGIIGAI